MTYSETATTETTLVEALTTKPLVFLDCEMTGALPPHNRLLDIGFLKAFLKGLACVEEYESKVRVFHGDIQRANRKALRMVGYSDREWKHARPTKEVLQHLAASTNGCIPVFWDARYDLEILDEEAKRHEMQPFFPDGYIDVQLWAQARLGRSDQPNLHVTADRFKIPYGRMHRGHDDAYVLYELTRMLWRFGTEELLALLPTLTWESYRVLAGPIALDDETTTARAAELSSFFVTRQNQLAQRIHPPRP